jgi:hypothetical protein
LTAQIWLVGDEEEEPLLAEVIPVQRQDGWISPPPPAYGVDLSEHAGSEVTLLFRAMFRGGARMGPHDLAGFALIWEDPRIETAALTHRSGAARP